MDHKPGNTQHALKAHHPNIHTVAKVPLMKLMKCGTTVLSKICTKRNGNGIGFFTDVLSDSEYFCHVRQKNPLLY